MSLSKSSKSKTVHYLIYSQISLLAGLLICYLILPEFLNREGGVSNFGVHRQTVVPFTVGLALNALFIILAARSLPSKPPLFKRLAKAFYGLAILSVLALVSTYPYKVNITYTDIHQFFSIALFLYEIILGVWLAVLARKDWLSLLFFAAQFLASVLALLTTIGKIHLLFVSEVGSVAAFGALLIRSIFILTSKKA